MQEYFKDLLRLAKSEIKPDGKAEPGIHYSAKEDKLVLTMLINGVFQQWILEDDDYNMSPTDLVAEMIRHLENGVNNG